MSGTTVLLVEDQADVREMLEDFLKCLNFIVLPFEDPHKALSAFEQLQNEIHLIISDFALGAVKSSSFLEEVHQQNPKMPMILISGIAELAIREELPKGFEIEILESNV